jgi:RNA polymerase sigma-70 factor, ECF subfamily
MAGPEPTADLLARARAGSTVALDALFRRCAPRLLTLIRLKMGRTLRAKVESRDILQATLLKAFQQIEQLRGADMACLMAWLARIAENEIRDQADFHRRRRRDVVRQASLDDAALQVAAEVTSAVSRIVLSERAERLEAAIEALAPDHREIILLRKFEERSFKEIAQRLGGRQRSDGGQFTITLIGRTPRDRMRSAMRKACPSAVTAYSSRMGEPSPSGSVKRRCGADSFNSWPP